MTRKEYMEEMSKHELNSPERKKIHRDYYAQFINDNTRSFVRNVIGLDKIKRSRCEHLNDVVRMTWAFGWAWDDTPINSKLAKELGENTSKSTRTCVGKACAVRMQSQTDCI